MKKVLIILFIFISLTGYCQVKIRIGETGKIISTYYKNKGYTVETKYDEMFGSKQKYIEVQTIGAKIEYYLNPKGICVVQYVYFNTNEKYINACVDFNISTKYNSYARTINKVYYTIKSSADVLTGIGSFHIRKREAWQDME